MKKTIELTDDIISLFKGMLFLSTQKIVIRKGGYFNTKIGKLGNHCADFQNFMYEQFGLFYKDNMLSEENKKKVEEYMKKVNGDE